jgi:hypothetical protein
LRIEFLEERRLLSRAPKFLSSKFRIAVE